MKIRVYYNDDEEDYVEELSALANEIMMTEGASETHATLRAAGMVDELLEYAKNWDDDVVRKRKERENEDTQIGRKFGGWSEGVFDCDNPGHERPQNPQVAGRFKS